MSLLPSPIPHPLDYCPWDLPGWVSEALDWVVGVEWPDGDERAVWDLADQWYAVADALAGPRDDAFAAAAEVRSGYGGIGAVAEAFDTAWRRVAEGDEAPLPVLMAVSADLGRLVEECGCDIEGAKLEVWIELGILVVELLSLAVAAVLTAGAASPAAGAAITATRVVVQQIFKRLLAQMARKALKQGLKEAGERAAKEVAKGGARGLARRAVKGGLFEAGEEAGVSLATQAYQNSTGRRHGLDLADLGASAVGGLAGGAVAPLAGLGRRATGRAARIGEHFGREMTGEVLAEGAAGLATGQGVVSVEEAARAAVSGVSGSATGQAHTELHARLGGRMHALAGAPLAPSDLPVPPLPPIPSACGESSPGPPPAEAAHASVLSGESLEAGATATGGAAAPTAAQPGYERPSVASQADPAPDRHAAAVASGTAGVQQGPDLRIVGDADRTLSKGAEAARAVASPTLSAVTVEHPPAPAPQVVDPPPAPPQPATPVPATAGGPVAHVGAGTTVGTLAGSVTTAGASPPAIVSPTSPGPVSSTANDGHLAPSQAASPATAPHSSAPGPVHQPSSTPQHGGRPEQSTGVPERGADASSASRAHRFPLLETLAPGPATTPMTSDQPSVPSPVPAIESLRPRTPEWYAAKWAADREGLERRRYRGYFEAQRAWYEDRRRRDSAEHLRDSSNHYLDRARWFKQRAREAVRAGLALRSEHLFQASDLAERDSYELADLADATRAGAVVPDEVVVEDAADFQRINDDVADLAPGAVETDDRSALTGDDDPPPIERSRRYGQWGGLRPPLALHQTDLERQMPRNPDGTVVRTADPREGGWFALANDGGPEADPTRGINCLDCTLSLYDTWLHGRPRVSAPRTFDGYLEGDVRRPIRGEAEGPARVEEVTGGRFQRLFAPRDGQTLAAVELGQSVERAFNNLHDQLVIGGHGSYAFLITEWENGGSHAWVALNQNGTVLFLDPQSGSVSDRPLYTHCGAPGPDNAVAIDALVLGRDGQPMPLGGLARGRFSVLPDLPNYPPAPDDQDGHGDPYLNRIHLLDGPGSTTPESAGEPVRRAPEPDLPTDLSVDDQDALRRRRDGAIAERLPTGRAVRDILAASADLDAAFTAGVTPAELATELDAAELRRLAPHLNDKAADALVRLFADPRLVRMLDEVWQTPPRGMPMLGEALVRQLTQHPDLVRMILATPELANSLTARPMTLHHLASHQPAIDMLGAVVADVDESGAASVADERPPPPLPTPISEAQRRVSASVAVGLETPAQPGFDRRRSADEAYRTRYLDDLYAAAAVAQAELNRIATDLAHDGSGVVGQAGWRQSPKDRRRAEDKVVKYRNDVSKLRDLAAAKVEFRSLDQLYGALARLRDLPELRIVRCEDRFVNPQDSGYRDVQLVLEMSNGHLAEFRLHLAALDEVAVWEHALFEVRRDLDSLAREDGRALSGREKAIADSILRRQQQLFWRALLSTFEEMP
ncbi:toxin glutamine deamidase domain-containing protein [Micromonospora sp. CPCC 205711]|uniref:toxin glutamine deamidase domain-containing protein n=1 Tax=Micromonospora sp. CPCC 205547 TaxID=3122400 RepID=UPI002FF3BB65